MPLQATSGAASYDAFGGGVPVVPQYIEEVFSTQVYTGTGATNNIVNGIDLAGKGGLVWTKARTTTSAFTFAHALMDTVRGAGIQICSDRTDANTTQANSLTAFNSNGYTLGADTGQARVNNSSYGTQTYVGWTFRKQEKFFDVVTYTGNGGTPQNIAHSLGSVPGFIVVKPTSITGGWICYHRSLTASGFNPAPYNTINLNSTGSILEDTGAWNITAPTSTVFTIGSSPDVNTNGVTYVAYLFAHDAGGFGLTGTDNVISCGSYTTDGSGVATVNLGYEPQWVLTKATSGTYGTTDWVIADNMRGMPAPPKTDGVGGLFPNLSSAEDNNFNRSVHPTSTGFVANQYNSTPYIYIAIRRGPMKVPTSGTSVFNTVLWTGNSTNNRQITGVGFNPDFVEAGTRSAASTFDRVVVDRLRGASPYLVTYATQIEQANSDLESFDNDGITVDYVSSGAFNNNSNIYGHFFRRAPSFFDEVCYTGTGSARTITHNLGAVPELMIMKRRDATANWPVYTASTATNEYLFLNSGGLPTTATTVWNNTAPTSSVFSVGTSALTNASAGTYVAYLFQAVLEFLKSVHTREQAHFKPLTAALPVAQGLCLLNLLVLVLVGQVTGMFGIQPVASHQEMTHIYC